MQLLGPTVIIGGGIVRLSTTYYLFGAQESESNITVVDISPDLVSAASAKGNGVLADFGHSDPISDFAHLSCATHEKFAEDHDGPANWGYAKTLRHWLSYKKESPESLKPHYPIPEWVREREKYHYRIKRNPKNCARCNDPRKFVTFLRKQCEDLGVNIMLSSEVMRVAIDGESIASVSVRGPQRTKDLPCRNLVISAGAWSQRIIENLFPMSNFKLVFDKTHLAGENWLILKAPRHSGDEYCHQVYVEDITRTHVEISDYRDGRIYVGGYLAEPEILPKTPSDVKPQTKWGDEKKNIAMQFVDFGEDGPQVLEIGRCCRPILAMGRLIIAKIVNDLLLGHDQTARVFEGRGGVFVDTGQGTSGINLGPANGLVLSELMRGLQPSVDISGLGLPVNLLED